MMRVLREQVGIDWTDGTGKRCTRYFDLFVEQTDGRRNAYPVKPEAWLSDKFMDEITAIARAARKSGFVDDVRLLTNSDLDPIELANARLGHGMRVPGVAAGLAIAAMSSVVTLGDLVDRIGLGARGCRALIRPVRNGRLRATRHEHLSHFTQLFNTGTAA